MLAEVPGCKVAADQAYREYDLAVDFCEEVAPLDEEEVDRIVAVFERHGATAKVSSIHVNGYFGAYDKLSMCQRAMTGLLGRELDPGRCIYFGDSPNDEPMFSYFPHGVGVANVRRWAHRMKSLPTYVTEGRGAKGSPRGFGWCSPVVDLSAVCLPSVYCPSAASIFSVG